MDGHVPKTFPLLLAFIIPKLMPNVLYVRVRA